MRRMLLATLGMSLAVAGLVVPFSGPAAAAALTEVTNFGSNPGGARMHVYVPDTRPAEPALLVALHGCSGTGPAYYSSTEYRSLADRYGFIVIYPTAMQNVAGLPKCWDNWSAAAKKRDGGSDPVSLHSMITYAEKQYRADPARVYVTGSSSGGMMTNAMLALYPDVFAAGAAFMGVPFDCFENAADYPQENSKCTGGSMNRTPAQWAASVTKAYPGYTGPRPPMQLWHGTADTTVPFSLLQEEVDQWTQVSGLSQTPTATDTPKTGWTRRRFGTQVEAYTIQGAGHSLPQTGMAGSAITFFGLDRNA